MTHQDQIDAFIATLLASITIANGYNTNAGDNVYKQLEYTEHPDIMPSVAWFPGDLQTGLDVGSFPAEMGDVNHLYPISFEGFITDDLDGAAGRMLKADLVKALFSDTYMGGLVEIIDGCKSSVAVQAGDEIFSIVQVGFQVLYTTPYGQE